MAKSKIGHQTIKINNCQFLPPIGVFWDIENCQVPKGKSALATAQLIRKKFFDKHREAEFMCVCDISKESKEVIQELNNAQVTVVHINATGKNAADDKLRQSMRRFADIHGSPSTIVLISGDVNFAADLSDFNHRRHIRIVVLHNNFAPEPLLACAHEHCNFVQLLTELPFRTPVKTNGQTSSNCELLVTKLPLDHPTNQIRSRLKQLSDNCGGRVVNISQSTAVIRFPTPEAAQRAKKRMTKEDVYGSKISVNFPSKHELCDSTDNSVPTSPAKRVNYALDENNRVIKSYSPKINVDVDKSFYNTNKYGKGCDFPPPPTITPLGNIFNSSWLDLNTLRQSPQHQPSLANSINVKNHVDPSPVSIIWPQRGIIPIDKTIFNSSLAITEGFNGFEQSKVHHENVRAQLKASRPSRRRVKSIGQSVNRSVNGSPYNHLNLAWNQSQNYVLSAPRTSSRRSQSRSISPMVDEGALFQPIVPGDASNAPVDLLVTNLDQTLDIDVLKETVLAVFREYVQVTQLNMVVNTDGNITAMVRVNSMHDAQYAISQLHRQKVGFRRIIISVANNSGPSLPIIK